MIESCEDIYIYVCVYVCVCVCVCVCLLYTLHVCCMLYVMYFKRQLCDEAHTIVVFSHDTWSCAITSIACLSYYYLLCKHNLGLAHLTLWKYLGKH